jgi:hypothetical protein
VSTSAPSSRVSLGWSFRVRTAARRVKKRSMITTRLSASRPAWAVRIHARFRSIEAAMIQPRRRWRPLRLCDGSHWNTV